MDEDKLPDMPFRLLTATERRCLRPFHRYSAKEIGLQLGIAQGTVETHLKRARAKLKAANSTEASYALNDYEAALSRRLGTEPPGRDLVPPLNQILTVDPDHEVREPAPATFPLSWHETDLDECPDQSTLRSLGLLALILLIFLAGLVLLKPSAESVQQIANLVQRPTKFRCPEGSEQRVRECEKNVSKQSAR